MQCMTADNTDNQRLQQVWTAIKTIRSWDVNQSQMDQMTLDGATKFHNGSRDSHHTKFWVMSHAWPNPFFKCEVYTFIHSKDMTGPKISKHDPCQLPSPLSGMVCHSWAMITYVYVRNLKSLSPPVMIIWKAMKKVENGGGLGLLEVTQGHWKMSSVNTSYY